MAKTRKQKEKQIKEIENSISKNGSFLAFGFSKISVNDLNKFRTEITEVGAVIRVVKKNLLNIALKNNDVDFTLNEFLGQIGFVIFKDDLSNIAGIVYDFINKKNREGKILGGYDIDEKQPLASEYLEKIGRLPSRDILLGQVASGISGPIRSFVYTLKAIVEKSN